MAESVAETYVNEPENLSTTYDGQNHWIDSFSDAWLETYHTDEDTVAVQNVSYAPYEGAVQNLGTDTTQIVDAGVYTVTMGLVGGKRWSDETITDMTFTITVAKANPNVTPKFTAAPLPNPLYTSYNDGKLPELTNNAQNATDGVIEWQSDQSPTEGTTVYYWQFTPTNTNNYKKIEGKSAATQMTVPYTTQGIDHLELTLRMDGEGEDAQPVKIYNAYSLADLKKYIKVEAVYDDGVTKVALGDADYDFKRVDNQNKLTVGSVAVRAVKKNTNETGNLTINVLEAKVEELSADYDDNGTHLVYSDTLTEADVKNNLAVTARWNYSGTKFLPVAIADVTVTGDIKAGDNLEFTAAYGGKDCTFYVTIDKGDYSISDSVFQDKTVTHTGTAYDPEDWIDTTKLPTGMTVTYSCPTDMTALGEHTVTATFSNPDHDNYNDPAAKTAKLTISSKPTYPITWTFEDKEVEYNSAKQYITIGGTLPDGVTVKYYLGDEEFTGATDVDEYEITAKFTGSDEYAPIDSITATLKITKADYDTSGVTFEDSTVIYDGEKHELKIGGVELPEWITVTYEYSGDLTAAGTYEITAKFTIDEEHAHNYKPIADMTAKLTINDAVVTEIKAELAEKNYTTANTLDDLKAKLKVTAVYSNGTTAEVEDYELSCDGLREGEMFKFGLQKITVKYTDGDGNEYSTFVEIGVDRKKVALPTFKGSLSYTGVELKPKAADFNGYDETLMTFVTDKLQSGLAVGSYKAVFALNDPENYEWATATTLKKTVFAAAIYDGEVTLLASEAAVDWNISKALLTATKTDGALPVFASESFIGAFADVVTLKYYKDEACTEEVAADQLKHETQYFVKAELLDTDNFELDASAAQYTVKSFTYTTPAKELTVWDKIVNFLKANWLWLVIAVVALILLITIIALAAKSAKRKREREERRLAEEKAERERKEEERREREEQRRREEREERMARMSQQQAMPAMMPQYAPQPQYMPQSMPQNAQSAPTGGGSMDGSQFALIQAELAAIKAEQSAAKELAAMRAEQSAAMELAELKAREAAKEQAERSRLEAQVANMETHMSGDRFSGINMDAMTEIMTRALKNVFASAAQPVVTAPPAQPAQLTDGGSSTATANAVYPPDAVMTTVTTTKIDTTKKPVQSAPQAAPAGRTIVRNVVAPMPVDDGRVFDVGGFYKPADPLTDMGFGEEEKKDL